jgi:DNA primase
MGRPLSIQEVGRLFSLNLPGPRGKAKCPFRQHARKDKTFRIFNARATGQELYKCWSCDPPDNVGDAIGFYAKMFGCDRKEAWKKLRDEGFDVPGLDKEQQRSGQRGTSREEQDRLAYEKMAREAHIIDVKGVRPPKVLPLDLEQWESWRKCNEGALDKFAEQRGLPADFLREHGVVELPGGYVGFTYFDPVTRKPCRVKVRGVNEKKYWVEPRPPKNNPSGAAALGPLYLATELEREGGQKFPLIITEGEIDALSLVYMGFKNVVSLPDGSESAKTVDLSPVYHRYTPWMLSTDLDKPGELSAQQLLKDRAYSGTDLFRVKWVRMVEAAGTEELVGYKDANDALRNGFTREEFLMCLEMAVGRCRFGKPAWRLAG